MVNNFEQISKPLNFRSKDDFYYLQILLRKKDLPKEEMGHNNSARCIKNYYIESVDHLLSKEKEIIKLCDNFGARACIRLNRRSYKNTSFRTLQKMAGIMANGDYQHINRAFSKACGTGHNEGSSKTWVVDLDEPEHLSEKFIEHLKTTLNMIQPLGSKFIDLIPSKSGFHMIRKPFNLNTFKVFKTLNDIDIHKDNPTN